MNKLTLSWTKLNTWARRDYETFDKLMLGERLPETFPMKYGKDVHERIAKEKALLIPVLSRFTRFEDTTSRHKHDWKNRFEVTIDDWIQINGVVDAYDPNHLVMVDWKTGNYKSTEHSKMQIYVYAYCYDLLDIPVNYGIIGKVNEVDGEIVCEDYSVYKITEEKLDLAHNYIVTCASEIADYLNFIP